LQEDLAAERHLVPTESAGIDEPERPWRVAHGAVNPIASHTRLVGHERGTHSDQAVEQRALADVGRADDRDDR
jgi:hypothetical protein